MVPCGWIWDASDSGNNGCQFPVGLGRGVRAGVGVGQGFLLLEQLLCVDFLQALFHAHDSCK